MAEFCDKKINNNPFRKLLRIDLRGVFSTIASRASFERGLKVSFMCAALLLPVIVATANSSAVSAQLNEPRQTHLSSFPGAIAVSPDDIARSDEHPQPATSDSTPEAPETEPPENSGPQENPEFGTRDPESAVDEGLAEEKPGESADESPDLPLAESPRFDNPSLSILQKPVKVAYITIDDGPSRLITPRILDLLAQEGIKATFFVLAHSGVDDIYQRIIDEGHEIGNHTYSHIYSRLYNPNNIDAFKDDVLKARDFMQERFDYQMTSFRFPGGSMSWRSSIIEPRREFLYELGYRIFDWHIDSGDSQGRGADRSAEALTRNVLNNTRNREYLIILFHDTWDKSTTLEALPMIIAGLREQGYTFDILRNFPE